MPVADVAWDSPAFAAAHRAQTQFTRAPEICVEVVLPSNARKELEEKTATHLAAGAAEVRIVLPNSKRVDFFGAGGRLPGSAFPIDLAGPFD